MPKEKDYPGLHQKKGNWYGYWYDPHQHPRVRLYPLRTKNRRDAWALYSRLKRDYAEGTFDPWEKPADTSLSFADAVAGYLGACAHQSEATIKRKRSVLHRFAAHVGTRPPLHVRPDDVRAFLDGLGVRPRTRRVYLREIQTALSHFETEGLVKKNVAAEVAVEEARYPVYHGAADYDEREALMPSELDRLLGLVRDDDRDRAYLLDVFELAACCALRAGEVCAALRRHVRLHPTLPAGSLTVESYRLPDGRRFNTKNRRSNRQVSLVPRAAMLLRRALAEPGDPDDYLFTKPRAGTGLDKQDLSKKFREYADALGHGRTVVLHSLRHSGLSWLAMLGVPPRDLMRFAGHGSLQTQDRYVKVAERRLQGGAFAVAEELLGWLCPGADAAPVLATVSRGPQFGGVGGGAIRAGDLAVEALFNGYLYDAEARGRFRDQLEALLATL